MGRTQVSGWLAKFRSDLTSVEGAKFWGRLLPVRRTDESVRFFLTESLYIEFLTSWEFQL